MKQRSVLIYKEYRAVGYMDCYRQSPTYLSHPLSVSRSLILPYSLIEILATDTIDTDTQRIEIGQTKLICKQLNNSLAKHDHGIRYSQGTIQQCSKHQFALAIRNEIIAE